MQAPCTTRTDLVTSARTLDRSLKREKLQLSGESYSVRCLTQRGGGGGGDFLLLQQWAG